jgi:hypothetical protein
MVDSKYTVVADLLTLWKRQSRSFLAYIVEVASPVQLDESDAAALAAFKELHEAELPLHKRIFELLVRMGKRPDLPTYTLKSSQYNFVRGRNLAQAFLEAAGPELEILKSHLKRYEGCDSLEERLLKGILDDMVKVRSSGCAALQKIVQDAARADAALLGDVVPEEEVAEVDASATPFPWHDESLGLDERMKLAEGKGVFERLYAAMAQTDCTACGYDCEGYARAIADGEDNDLTKCAPGMDETREMLNKIMGK